MSGRSSGPKKAGALGPDELDSLYAELRCGPRDRLGREPDGPTFLDVGSAEVFRDEITAFASGLWAAGGQAELHVRPGGATASTSSPPARSSPDGPGRPARLGAPARAGSAMAGRPADRRLAWWRARAAGRDRPGALRVDINKDNDDAAVSPRRRTPRCR
jgi:hypothetical protein